MRRVWREIYADHTGGSRRHESRRTRSGFAACAALRIGPAVEPRRPRQSATAPTVTQRGGVAGPDGWRDADKSGQGPVEPRRFSIALAGPRTDESCTYWFKALFTIPAGRAVCLSAWW